MSKDKRITIADLGATLSVPISLPLAVNFVAQPDITAYELASALPFFFGKQMYEADWDALGNAQRHWVRLR